MHSAALTLQNSTFNHTTSANAPLEALSPASLLRGVATIEPPRELRADPLFSDLFNACEGNKLFSEECEAKANKFINNIDPLSQLTRADEKEYCGDITKYAAQDCPSAYSFETTFNEVGRFLNTQARPDLKDFDNSYCENKVCLNTNIGIILCSKKLFSDAIDNGDTPEKYFSYLSSTTDRFCSTETAPASNPQSGPTAPANNDVPNTPRPTPNSVTNPPPRPTPNPTSMRSTPAPTTEPQVPFHKKRGAQIAAITAGGIGGLGSLLLLGKIATSMLGRSSSH